MATWERVRLGELVETQKGFAFKSGWYCDLGRPIVKVSDFTDDSIDSSNLVCIPENIAADYLKYELKTGDVVIQTVGSWPTNPASVVGKCVRIPHNAAGLLLNQNAVKLSPSNGIDSGFLFYLLRNDDFKSYIIGTAQGAASQAAITLDSIRGYEFDFPPLEMQQRITGILSAYDKLIENNQRRIRILEEMARTLYREWFVHFRFPGHKKVPIVTTSHGDIPRGWEVGRLDDVLVLQRGFDLPKANRNEGTIPIYAATGVTGFHNEAKVKAPGVITGRSGTIGDVLYVQEDFWPLNTALWVKEFPKAEPLYAYYVLSSLDLKQFNSGAAVPTLNRNDIHGIDILIPPRLLQKQFQETAGAMLAQIRMLELEIQNLRCTRDLLLPSLMQERII